MTQQEAETAFGNGDYILKIHREFPTYRNSDYW